MGRRWGRRSKGEEVKVQGGSGSNKHQRGGHSQKVPRTRVRWEWKAREQKRSKEAAGTKDHVSHGTWTNQDNFALRRVRRQGESAKGLRSQEKVNVTASMRNPGTFYLGFWLELDRCVWGRLGYRPLPTWEPKGKRYGRTER